MPRHHPNYKVDSDTALKRAFPKDVPVPALLLDWAAWMRDKPWGSVGTYHLRAGMVDTLLPSGADEGNNLAMFLGMPDGGQVGLWLVNTRESMAAPVVHLSSEGAMSTLAANLPLFLWRLAQAKFNRRTLQVDFLPSLKQEELEDDEASTAPLDLTSTLKAWLQSRADVNSALARAKTADLAFKDDGKAKAWFNDTVRRIEDAKKSDPTLQAIRAAMVKHRLKPRPQDGPWACHTLQVFAAGQTMVIRTGRCLTPMPNIERHLKPLKADAEELLRPLIFEAREAHARRKKGEGLWPSSYLHLYGNGTVDLQPNYHHEYAIGYDRFQAEAFASDQARLPRTPSKLSAWQKAMIERGSKALKK